MTALRDIALGLLERADLTRLEERWAQRIRRILCRSPRHIAQLATLPSWVARWTAVRGAERALPPTQAWELALHLATDPEAVVRRAAARTLSALWHRDPTRGAALEERIASRTSPGPLIETILDACTDLFSRHPEDLENALALLRLAGRQPPAGALLSVGSVRVGIELERQHPEVAQLLRDEWATSGSPHLRYHAAWAGGSHTVDPTVLRKTVDAVAPLPESWKSAADVPVAQDVVPHMIGREDVQLAFRLAAMQRRGLVLTGRSASLRRHLAQTVADLLPEGTDDIASLPDAHDAMHPLVRRAPGGTTAVALEHARNRHAHRVARRTAAYWIACAACVVTGTAATPLAASIALPAASALALGLLLALRSRITAVPPPAEPHMLATGSQVDSAPFTDGTKLSSAELFGHVQERSDGSAPHERIVLGAVQRAHRGVLYLESPDTLSAGMQRELLAVLQSGHAAIRGREIASSIVESQPIPCEVLLVLGFDAQAHASESGIGLLEPEFAAWLRRNADEMSLSAVRPDTPAHPATC